MDTPFEEWPFQYRRASERYIVLSHANPPVHLENPSLHIKELQICGQSERVDIQGTLWWTGKE